MTPQTRIPLIANGTVDIECGTTVNSLSRQEQVDFSYAIALAEGRMLVRASSGIHDLPGLDGKIVALAAGTTALWHDARLLSADRSSTLGRGKRQ